MTKPFKTTLLDRVLSARRRQLEEERQALLRRTIEWLDKFASQYGINRAYIFGSLTQADKFHAGSDIDIAVEEINAEDFCSVISFISEAMAREKVDLIEINKCHFADKIRQTGILWTKKTLAILKADLQAQLDLIKTIYTRLTERANNLQPDDLIRLESVCPRNLIYGI